MSLPDEYLPIARAINMQSRFMRNEPAWWGTMLSSVVLTLGPIEFEDLKYLSDTTEGESYKLVVVATSLIVVAEAEELANDNSEWSVTAYPLNELESVGVRASEAVFGDHFGRASWPGRLRVDLNHAQFGTMTWPLSAEENRFADEKLLGLLPELLSIVRERS